MGEPVSRDAPCGASSETPWLAGTSTWSGWTLCWVVRMNIGAKLKYASGLKEAVNGAYFSFQAVACHALWLHWLASSTRFTNLHRKRRRIKSIWEAIVGLKKHWQASFNELLFKLLQGFALCFRQLDKDEHETGGADARIKPEGACGAKQRVQNRECVG